ncbi:hypothetical protein [Micromonospora sp. NPDC005367]|uniref:hypothetical protein n=1 Tax=Micromonospora sp. NPDC005367 TaxID=3155590 RepID=UPI0033A1BC65
MTTEPAAVPAANADQAVLDGIAVQDTYQAKVFDVRNDRSLSELDRAEQLTAMYEQSSQVVQELSADFDSRRHARLAHLEAQIPRDPGITDGTSAADRAVLLAAFRTALETARQQNRDQRRQALAEAERYGDDMQRRATLAAAWDDGQGDIIAEWAGEHLGPQVWQEMQALRESLSGAGPDRGWRFKAFRALTRPAEAANLDVLRQRATRDAELAAREARAARLARPAYLG